MSVVGIDLGTTNTVVGCVRSGKVHVLADEKGVRLLPSVVSFHPNGEILVGGVAKSRRIIDAKNTVYSHKRLIGRSWGSAEITQARNRFAFELREGPGQGPLIHARNQDYTLPEISAFVLKRARQIAETALGTAVERAVITVPAHFNELQRASTKVAGRVSGLEVLRILNEPTAAALAYGLGRSGNERVAVYDFGGGTFDCTLLDLNGNVFEVLATAGDSFLGGDDIDNLIADRMAEVFLKQHRQDARQDPQLYERLKTTAEDVKMALSTAETHSVVLKDFGHGPGGVGLNFQFSLSRKDLEALITPLVERSFKVTQDALALARLSPTSFDKVILVGGSTRVPLIRKRVESFFGAPPMDRVNPDEVVAIGAAIQAAALTEGIRRRSIPAPPGVQRRPSQHDTQDNTQTNELDPSLLKPAFGSEPPAFGFASQSGSGPPDKFAFASTVGSNPPGHATNPAPAPAPTAPPGGAPTAPPNAAVPTAAPTNAAAPTSPPSPGAAAARVVTANADANVARRAPPGGPAGSVSRQTRPGVAPATQPMGARPAPKPGPSQAAEDDPSFASFPDLSSPTPFEWFPAGAPTSASGGAAKARGAATSERTFGGNDPKAMAKTALSGSGRAAQPEAATPAQQQPDDGFGAIDEPPSLVSTATASFPSFPSTGGAPAGAGRLKSPLGAEPFGAVADLSLVSTTANVTAVAGAAAPPSPSAPSRDDEDAFGHVSDLSLISTTGVGTGSPARDLVTKTGHDAPFGAIDETEVLRERPAGSGNTVQLDPSANPAAARGGGIRQAPARDDGKVDLPSVAPKAKPARHQPGQVGFLPDGQTGMTGKAPPLIAPQPFGPMERIDEPPPHTRAMQAPQQPGAPPPAPSRPHQQAAMAQTNPMPAVAARAQATDKFGSSGSGGSGQPQVQPYGGPPPQPLPARHPHAAAAAPPQVPVQAQVQPPPRPPSFAPPAAPAPAASANYASAAPPMGNPFSFGSTPPQNMASQPPIFGSFGSSPPDGSIPLDYTANLASQPQQQQPMIEPPLVGPPPQGGGPSIQYQSPVLVDVTPRALVVETAGGYTDTIIPRNSKIPCERTRRFTTGRDMQTTVRVRVGQGESPNFPQNTFLGEVELSGLRPAPRGDVTVAVTFEVDADGTLRVRARDVQTGQEARATLQLVGVADESSVVMMINRFAQQPVVGGSN